MKLLPNGNIEVTVQLMPDAYAALARAMERDKCSRADVINVAVMTHDVVSAAATKAGTPLSAEMSDKPKAEPAESPVGTNTGHGHVWARPDGMKARCGGPGMCAECAHDQARLPDGAWD